MTTGAFILVAVAGLLWAAYRPPLRRRWVLVRPAAGRPAVSAVERQHRHLQAGGHVGETTFETTKARIGRLLADGRTAEVEGELRPGLGFAVQVRALAELGTPEAGRLLERQLGRSLSRDPAEQSWYWADVAAGLRKLNRTAALPAVLRCADAAAGLPQGAVLAAEAVAFPNFPALLRHPDSPDGRHAVRAVARAARGCRDGLIDPVAMLRAGLGDQLATLGGAARPNADPWLTLAMLEAERVARRLDHWAARLAPEARPLAAGQAARLAASAGRRAEWLDGAAPRLIDRFPTAPDAERSAALACLAELRADTSELFPRLPSRRAAWWAHAMRALTWAKDPTLGPRLADLAAAKLGARWDRAAAAAVLAALRGHRCEPAEWVLLKAAAAPNPADRRAAVGALGWWDPFDPAAVVGALRAGRADPDPGVRRAAAGALARLGERAAVREFADALAGEDSTVRRQAVLAAAAEGLTWLWPDLQGVAEGPDPDAALAAAEALERLRENLFGPAG